MSHNASEESGSQIIKEPGNFARDFLFGYTFYRDIHVGERLLAFGHSEKMRGSLNSRLFYWTSGGIAVVDERGRLEMVIAASGQYMGVAELTAQMKMELIPKELTFRAFSLAGSESGPAG